jgi:hypothetical protein
MELPSVDLIALTSTAAAARCDDQPRRANPQPLPPDATIQLLALNPQQVPLEATINLVALTHNRVTIPPGVHINLVALNPQPRRATIDFIALTRSRWRQTGRSPPLRSRLGLLTERRRRWRPVPGRV